MFIILIAGAIVVGSALIVEVKYQPPFWVHAALWLPLILAVTLWPLRAMKSLLIALQFHHKAAEGRLIEQATEMTEADAAAHAVGLRRLHPCRWSRSSSASASGNCSAASRSTR